ncbi:hypothetical protein [Streptomyces canus]|uniref:hypothetical protein n=1 Tax=Streptomyces canus TaxID=58343 RepID=UPI00371AEC4A
MERVILEPGWRGVGLGPALAGSAIRRLSQGCAAVACEPGSADGRELTADQHRDAAVKLGRVWQRIGFESFQDGVHLLDCHLQRTEDLLAEQQGEFLALCQAWRSPTARRCTVARSLPRQTCDGTMDSRVMAVARGVSDIWRILGRLVRVEPARCASLGRARSSRGGQHDGSALHTSTADAPEIVIARAGTCGFTTEPWDVTAHRASITSTEAWLRILTNGDQLIDPLLGPAPRRDHVHRGRAHGGVPCDRLPGRTRRQSPVARPPSEEGQS